MSKEIEETRAQLEKQKVFQKEVTAFAESLKAKDYTFCLSVFDPACNLYCSRWTGSSLVLAKLIGHLVENITSRFAQICGKKVQAEEGDGSWVN